MIGFNMGRFVLLVYMYTRSELYLRFDSSGTENVFHGFHGSTVDFTGLPQKQPISRTRDTVKKEGPWSITVMGMRYTQILVKLMRP